MAAPDQIARINDRLGQALAPRGIPADALSAPPGVLVTDQLLARRQADPHMVNEVLREVFGVEAIDPSMVALDPEFARNARLLFPRAEAFALRAAPLRFDRGTAHVVMAVPEDEEALAAIEHLLGSRVVTYVCHSEGLARSMAALYGDAAPGEGPSPDMDVQAGRAAKAVARILADHARERDPAEEAEVTALLRTIMDRLAGVEAEGAVSDIHLEPGARGWRVRARRDGMLFDALRLPAILGAALARRIMLLSGMDPGQTREPQDGAIGFTLAKGKPMDIRVSALPALYGQKIVMRLLEKGKKALRLEDLAFSDAEDRILRSALAAPNGLILVTGPTGSGKTTTLYAFLGLLNTPQVNILTAEDPVEYRLDGATQTPCPGDGGLTFAQAMRSFLRQDPDIIMAGEIRDAETADFAVKAALTGHLVLSTLHANDAPGSVSRLANMGVAPHLLAAVRVTVMAQRLVRRLCPHCRRESAPPPGFPGLADLSPDAVFFEPVGCEKCGGSGYRGRVGVYEVFTVSEGMQRLILDGSSAAELRKMAVSEGMGSLRRSALRRIEQGLTSAAEALRVTADA